MIILTAILKNKKICEGGVGIFFFSKHTLLPNKFCSSGAELKDSANQPLAITDGWEFARQVELTERRQQEEGVGERHREGGR